jgi:hypothetical protein
MIMTIEVVNPKSINLLRGMEDLGLIHVQAPASTEAECEEKSSIGACSALWLRGSCKNLPGSVDEFLARCRADKEHELAIEKRQEEERNHRARLSS